MSPSPISEIPRHFHRVWLGSADAYHEEFHQWWEEAKNLHPDWEYITWSDCLPGDDVRDPREELTPRFLTAFEKIQRPAMQSDLFRLFAMVRWGGVYLDTDMQILQSLDPYLEDLKTPAGVFREKTTRLANAMLVSAPGSQFFSRALVRVARNIEKFTGLPRSANPVLVTGPKVLTDEYRLSDSSEVTVLPEEKFLMGSRQIVGSHAKLTDQKNPASRLNSGFNTEGLVAVHHLAGTW